MSLESPQSKTASQEKLEYEPKSPAAHARFTASMEGYADAIKNVEAKSSVEQQESRWQKLGHIARETAVGVLEAPGKALEHLTTPVMQAVRKNIEQLILAGKDAVEKLSSPVIKAGGEAIKTVLAKTGEGTAIGSSEILEKVPEATGKGARGFVKGLLG